MNYENISFGYCNEDFDLCTSYKDKKPYIVIANRYKSTLELEKNEFLHHQHYL